MSFTNEIIGGLFIGVASALPLIFEGRIAGVSGYAATSLRPVTYEARTSLLFIVGLILGGIVWRVTGGILPDSSNPSLSIHLWSVAGLLVGFGSRLAGGCTSGHGVCGLGRLSTRSIVSVCIFISVAVVTRLLMKGTS